MDERAKSELLVAIRERSKENSRLEFKQRIELRTPSGKAEFVRDILALANSEGEIPRRPGLLVIGVKHGQIWDVATESYDGATFRDIARAHVAPGLQVNYEELSTEAGKRIGLLEIVADPNELYVVRSDFSGPDSKKLLVAGQTWGRLGDQKIRLSGDDIAGRIREVVLSASRRAGAPLRERISDLEKTIKRTGPAAEVRRIGYAIELESDWTKVPVELTKLIPYARDFGLEVGIEIVEVLGELAGRVSPATPVASIRSLTGVFRAILPFSADEAFRPRPAPLSEEARRLLKRIVSVECSIASDGAARLGNAEIVDVCTTITHECLRFAHVNGEHDLESYVLGVLDALIAICRGSHILQVQASARRLDHLRNDGLLSPDDRERLMVQAMESRRKSVRIQ